jgi:hypothetical protein
MPVWLQLLLTGVLVPIVGVVMVYLASRKKDTATEKNDRFQQGLDIAEMVRTEVEKVAAPLRERITALEKGVQDSRTILHAHFQRLFWWDERGRQGALPLPEDKDFEALGIDPKMFESTVERAVATAAVSEMRRTQSIENVNELETP